MKFLKGMCAGMILGAALGMTMMPEKKSAQRKLSKAMRTMRRFVESIGEDMGL